MSRVMKSNNGDILSSIDHCGAPDKARLEIILIIKKIKKAQIKGKVGGIPISKIYNIEN